MLGEEEHRDKGNDHHGHSRSNANQNQANGDNEGSQNLNDSYLVLMREIGISDNDGLSQAFLDKNGEA